jgi:cytochrome P450
MSSVQPHPVCTGSWLDGADLSPVYRELRESGPLCRVELPGGQRAWVVTRYAEITEFLADRRFTRDPREVGDLDCGFGLVRYPEDALSAAGRHLFNVDGDRHARLRHLLQRFFTVRAVRRYSPLIRREIDQALDRIAGGHRADLVADFARPVTLAVVGQIVGIPVRFREPLTAALSTVCGPVCPQDPAARDAGRLVVELVSAVIADRRAEPGDDVITAMLRAQHDDGSINALEVSSSIAMLLLAGVETTTSLLSHNALMALTDDRLRARIDTDGAACVDELLRHTTSGPVGAARFAPGPVDLHGTVVNRGEIVYPLFAAANRDPRVYHDPDQVRPGRGGPSHLAFGRGIRRCLGAELALAMAHSTLTELVRRFPEMRLEVDPTTLRWRGRWHIRGLTSLPVTVGGSHR